MSTREIELNAAARADHGSRTEARWRVRAACVAHENPHFRVVRSSVARPRGTDVEYHTLDFSRPAVSIVVRRPGATLLVRQQRFIVDRDVWALPSGGVEEGESLAAAAARELTEETGYRPRSMEHLLTYYPSYGVSNQVFHCFVSEDPQHVGVPDANEVERVAWFCDEDLQSLIAAGEIPDGFSLTPLLYLAAGMRPQPPATAIRCRRVSLDVPGGRR